MQLDKCHLMIALVWMKSLEVQHQFVCRTEEQNDNAAAASDERMVNRGEWCRNVVFHHPQNRWAPSPSQWTLSNETFLFFAWYAHSPLYSRSESLEDVLHYSKTTPHRIQSKFLIDWVSCQPIQASIASGRSIVLTCCRPMFLIKSSPLNSVGIVVRFTYINRQLYGDLARCLQVNNAILDYNYEPLRECIHGVAQERIRHELLPVTIAGSEQLRIDEYPLTLEFDLQIDGRLFFFLRWSTPFLQVC